MAVEIKRHDLSAAARAVDERAPDPLRYRSYCEQTIFGGTQVCVRATSGPGTYTRRIR